MVIRLLFFFVPFFLFAVPNPPERKSQAPTISGDAFREYADYVFDELDSSLHPLYVKPNKTIFVKTDMLDLFFKNIHPYIPCKYILITHNSDLPSPGEFHEYLNDNKLIAWFGQNYDGFHHPKMHPIPIGIANFCWPHGNAEILKMAKEKSLHKIHLAYLNFALNSYYQERWSVYKYFIHAPYCYHPGLRGYDQFLSDLVSSKFCVSPRGNGLDTHRIWESIYLGTIPIVKSSSLDGLYSDLPILIVPTWKIVTQKFLEQKYEEMQVKQYNLEKLSMDYWIKLIDSYKQEK
ncbi:MAG TPA: hypothetical protein VLG44_04970 [Chlamydiales bacterium]|nr:hypothetical protein [Chlamydiales bacterium]